ncbi:hypothetical protein G6F56_000167 [Rhizopus delemar]|uniref:NADH:flavin oxidoreductase/NADH oxidase N-terminal domain-containing protein n=1 Tax=Rhizopus stolonifer TaxID=4846 RepID=A0A367IXR9_RHIST|nr:hypothetical protein G6F56_000167 [Rhizopus delemar]RCH82464.1 hypothetical protein CU098_006635 [Rhizopus stolonifer]
MSKLFEPINIGQSQLQHRVVLAPLTRFRATLEAIPTDIMVEYYKQRASKGGLLITEATFIDRRAGSYPQAPGIYSKEQIEGWKKVTDAVHEKEGVIFLQIWHIGRVGFAKLNPNNEQIVSASAISAGEKDAFGQDYEVPRALEVNEIKEITQQFKQAALNAIEAGFDGVEIHNANGYLLDQFVNTSSNQRTDAYGGSAENRGRFTLEVVEAVTAAIGSERTGIRFSPEGSFQGMKDENPVETWSYLTDSLQKRYPNLAYLHFIEPRSSFFTEDVNTEDSLAPFRKLWNGPFITAGGFSTSVKQAEEVSTKTGGLVAFGRAFIANPDLPEKLKRDLPLNKYDRSTFYTHEATGYTDYPFHAEEVESRL